jgi:hypothetical protein
MDGVDQVGPVVEAGMVVVAGEVVVGVVAVVAGVDAVVVDVAVDVAVVVVVVLVALPPPEVVADFSVVVVFLGSAAGADAAAYLRSNFTVSPGLLMFAAPITHAFFGPHVLAGGFEF